MTVAGKTFVAVGFGNGISVHVESPAPDELLVNLVQVDGEELRAEPARGERPVGKALSLRLH